MFEIGWSELLVVGIVALIVVGPKELPALLRTVGRYIGIVKRQAAEFRAQFDDAMRESELQSIKKDIESIKTEAEDTLRAAERSVQTELSDARRELEFPDERATSDSAGPDAHDANGMPIAPPSEGGGYMGPSAGGANAAAMAAAAAAAGEQKSPEKVGA